MALTEPVERAHVHTRRLEIKGYRRADGLWDIEGHLTDAKPFFYRMEETHREKDEPIHDMWLRLTIDETFLVRDAEAVMDAGPFEICPRVTPNFKRLRGLRIAAGWNRKVRERLGGIHGCTHLVEMLGQMATTAMQTLWPEMAERRQADGGGDVVGLINTCHAYRADGPVVARHFPQFVAGEKQPSE